MGFGWMFLILGGSAQASHTPDPSREGRFGGWVLVGNKWFMVRGAVWDEMIFEEVSVGFGWLFLV